MRKLCNEGTTVSGQLDSDTQGILSFAAQRSHEANAMLIAAKVLLFIDAGRQLAGGPWREQVPTQEDARITADLLLDAVKRVIDEVMVATDLYAKRLQQTSVPASDDAPSTAAAQPMCVDVANVAQSLQEGLLHLVRLKKALDERESALADHSAQVLGDLLTRIQDRR